MTLSEELSWRGFAHQTTFPDATTLDSDPLTFYWGVDPSADSMTIGNLAIAMMVRHFISHGHHAVLLVGGATGLIGDPDGKSEERQLKTIDEIAQNKAGIITQYKQLFAGQSFQTVDNYDWFKGMGYLDFLRTVGKHVPMRQMLNRDFVQSRLGEAGAGISYAEFSYSLIQGYDFLHLFQEHNVTLQLCGSDQWGNSIAGVELIRRVTGQEAHIWSAPLVVDPATGRKFGKSESGAVWLDPAKTSVYQFYQFWLNTVDSVVIPLLKVYTLLLPDEITSLEQSAQSNLSARITQRRLAYEVTRLVHGQERADSVVRASEVLFGKASYDTLLSADFEILGSELRTMSVTKSDEIVSVLVKAELATSNSDANRLLAQGAVYINGVAWQQAGDVRAVRWLIDRYAVLRVGKNRTVLLRLEA
jgi:tyrosyl-tRNA synthetase